MGRRSLIWLAWIMILPCWLGQCWAQLEVDLQGKWEFREMGGKDWLPAQVPGTVHTDMMAAGLIPDPYFGDNASKLQWIEQLDWEYRKTFTVTEAILQQGKVEVVCEGLDTYAELRINDQFIGEADNMHRTWRFDCKPFLKAGENVITILFKSPMQQALGAYQALPYKLPSGNDAADIKLSPYVRKAAYHFGWDFAPRLLTAGVWRPIYLEAWSGARLSNVMVVPALLEEHQAQMFASVKLDVAQAGNYQIDFLLDGDLVVSTMGQLLPGQREMSLHFAIHEPEFWWPKGMGEPKLYDLGVKLKQNQDLIGEHHQHLGLREILLVRNPDSLGTGFYFLVNRFMPGRGGPLFIKGANYVPDDMCLPRGAARQQQLLESAEAVGMNMLRVWGGGVYADDAFYDWCDAHGMLVWQDLAFACMMYPLEGQFQDNARDEVQGNVFRLRHHPSLAIWCGNNEIDVAWHNWGWQQEAGFSKEFADKLWTQYQNFFDRELLFGFNNLDPGRAYIPSSPLSNWGKEENFKHNNMHYWGVWHGSDSLDGFAHYVPRFMSEYGFQSWPSPSTLQPYIDRQDWNADSLAIRNRQKSYKGNAPILRFLIPSYGKPRDFSAFCQLSQLVQRDAMRIAIEAHRMKSPFCMGTMYWQLNDCWPGPSWSTIDYGGNWKPAHYALKRLYAPVLVSATLVHDSLKVEIASELQPKASNLQIRLKSFLGDVLANYNAAIELQQNGRQYLQIPLSALSGRIDLDENLIEVVVHQGRNTLGEALVYFAAPTALKLPSPNYTYQVTGGAGRFQLALSAKTLVKELSFSVSEKEATFSDNYFDLVPGRPRTIEITAPGIAGTHEMLTLLSLHDLTDLIGK